MFTKVGQIGNSIGIAFDVRPGRDLFSYPLGKGVSYHGFDPLPVSPGLRGGEVPLFNSQLLQMKRLAQYNFDPGKTKPDFNPIMAF